MPALQSYAQTPDLCSRSLSLGQPHIAASSPVLRAIGWICRPLWKCLITYFCFLPQDPTLEFLRKFTIGLVSGTISSCVNIPFDVAKSRIQGPQPVPGEIKYRTCFQTMALVYREEGYGTIPGI